MHKYIKIFLVSAIVAICSVTVKAQDEIEPFDPDEMYNETQKAVESFMKRMTLELKLEDWQQFKLDSLLNVNFFGKTEELIDMNMRKISAANLYQMISDKWDEKTYEGMRVFLTDEQWKKYLKIGAEREKRLRDKRAAKK